MTGAAQAVHAERRRKLAERMARAGGGLAILPTAPERLRNGDGDHPYRHDSHFHYLTGFDEPQAWLLLDDQGRSTLLCREKNIEREIWDGVRLGPEAAPAALGVDAAHPVDALDKIAAEQLADRGAVWFPFGQHDGLHARIDGWLAEVRARERRGVQAPGAQRDLAPLLAEMRLFKDPTELETMRRAARISAGAHARAMRFCAAAFRRDAADRAARVRDRGRAAARIPSPWRAGAGLPSIVAAGANACVLHYAAGGTPLQAGQLVPDRCRLRTRRLRQRHDAHLSRRWTLLASATRALRHRARRAGSGDRRHAARRAQAGRPLGRGARAGAGHAGHGPARPQQGRRPRRGDRVGRLPGRSTCTAPATGWGATCTTSASTWPSTRRRSSSPMAWAAA